MSELVIAQEDKQEISDKQTEAEQFLQLAQSFTIRTQKDLDTADEAIRYAREQWKYLEAKRKEITKPIDAAKKAVQAQYKPVLDYLKSIEKEFKERIKEHAQAEEEKNRAAIEEGQTHAITNVSDTQGVSLRKRWVYEVTDPDAVPRELCSPDKDKIREYAEQVRERGEEPQILGVRVYQVTSVAARPGRKKK